MKILNFFPLRSTFVLVLLCAAISVAAPAQTFTTLADLSSTTGENPESPLTQGLDGNFYGSAALAGAFGGGTFFQVTPSGTVNALYNFCLNDVGNCPDGANPIGQIALGPDGNFYGTTEGGFYEAEGNGSIYKMTPGGTMTELYNFSSCPPCAAFPGWGVTLGRNGDFYGNAQADEADPSAFDNLVFKVSPSGTFTTVLVVCPNQICPIDAGPSGTLLLASGGNFIGAGPGGVNGEGAVYRMTPAGAPTVLYSYCADSTCHDGNQTTSPLVESTAGAFYGTNLYGGAGAHCTLSQGCGTAFRVTTSGAFTKLHDFCAWAGCTDGAIPNALIQATDGNFYGTTSQGGASGDGTVFSLTTTGHFTLIHSFSGTDGDRAGTALYQGTDGNLYGTTISGGVGNAGTIFRISLGLAPFVRTVQEAGAAGAPVIIFGNGLTGATSVTFNGTAATFTVVSDTEITTTVPAGATTGSIQVVTASSGTLSSNVAFVVLP
jgi:uncharacterized repeat protein (TIGR03803 family)